MLAAFFVMDTSISMLRWIIDVAIPDIPAAVELMQKRAQAINLQLIRRATSELKVWEGRELERAYLEAEVGSKTPQLLKENEHGLTEWMPTKKDVTPIVRRGSKAELLPWKPGDPGFEHAWFLQAAGGQDGAVSIRFSRIRIKNVTRLKLTEAANGLIVARRTRSIHKR